MYLPLKVLKALYMLWENLSDPKKIGVLIAISTLVTLATTVRDITNFLEIYQAATISVIMIMSIWFLQQVDIVRRRTQPGRFLFAMTDCMAWMLYVISQVRYVTGNVQWSMYVLYVSLILVVFYLLPRFLDMEEDRKLWDGSQNDPTQQMSDGEYHEFMDYVREEKREERAREDDEQEIK